MDNSENKYIKHISDDKLYDVCKKNYKYINTSGDIIETKLGFVLLRAGALKYTLNSDYIKEMNKIYAHLINIISSNNYKINFIIISIEHVILDGYRDDELGHDYNNYLKLIAANLIIQLNNDEIYDYFSKYDFSEMYKSHLVHNQIEFEKRAYGIIKMNNIRYKFSIDESFNGEYLNLDYLISKGISKEYLVYLFNQIEVDDVTIIMIKNTIDKYYDYLIDYDVNIDTFAAKKDCYKSKFLEDNSFSHSEIPFFDITKIGKDNDKYHNLFLKFYKLYNDNIRTINTDRTTACVVSEIYNVTGYNMPDSSTTNHASKIHNNLWLYYNIIRCETSNTNIIYTVNEDILDNYKSFDNLHDVLYEYLDGRVVHDYDDKFDKFCLKFIEHYNGCGSNINSSGMKALINAMMYKNNYTEYGYDNKISIMTLSKNDYFPLLYKFLFDNLGLTNKNSHNLFNDLLYSICDKREVDKYINDAELYDSNYKHKFSELLLKEIYLYDADEINDIEEDFKTYFYKHNTELITFIFDNCNDNLFDIDNITAVIKMNHNKFLKDLYQDHLNKYIYTTKF